MGNTFPIVSRHAKNAPAAATAVAANTILARAPFAGTVTKISYTPNANITGVNTDTRKIAVVNKLQNGSGTTEVGALQFNSGVNATAYDEKDVTLSGTAANLVVAEGDILLFASTVVGNGLADPGGHVILEFTRS